MKITKEIKSYVNSHVKIAAIAAFEKIFAEERKNLESMTAELNKVIDVYTTEIENKAKNFMIDGYHPIVSVVITPLPKRNYSNPEYYDDKSVEIISSEILLKISLNKNDLTLEKIDELIKESVENYYKK